MKRRDVTGKASRLGQAVEIQLYEGKKASCGQRLDPGCGTYCSTCSGIATDFHLKKHNRYT